MNKYIDPETATWTSMLPNMLAGYRTAEREQAIEFLTEAFGRMAWMADMWDERTKLGISKEQLTVYFEALFEAVAAGQAPSADMLAEDILYGRIGIPKKEV